MQHRAAPRASPPRQICSPDAPYCLTKAVREFERKYVANIVRLTDGNLDEAAALLGIAPQDIRDFVSQQTQMP
ncbi:response regulator containing CheY-like receiver [Candidatus Moduliflexus flocculans]|uniref:Response regulator containing CheY-like receiver n=1 Tax=Candidatus Moduliflexus flocculans TaxID=1499966 RepID=A0A081BQQ9_9BACT|nr:response regulator containing CheY-like receiver [Candidatus Moduliflexus flocculans]